MKDDTRRFLTFFTAARQTQQPPAEGGRFLWRPSAVEQTHFDCMTVVEPVRIVKISERMRAAGDRSQEGNEAFLKLTGLSEQQELKYEDSPPGFRQSDGGRK